jgi:hypothetical protein
MGVVDITSENKNQLLKILDESEIISPVNKKYFINLHKKLSQNYSPDNWKDFSFFRAFRNGKLKINDINLESSNSIFLLDKEQENINEINDEKNVISLGKQYDFKHPVSPKSFASKVVDKEMQGIECIKHRCRNVIIIDPYIFEDQPNLQPKIPNLIKFLLELYLNNGSANCFLSIITNHQDNDAKFNSKIQEISAGIKNPNLQISVYAHDKPHFRNNRHVITDYSIIDYQHLFDRDDASISMSFLYDGNVSDNFTRVQILKAKIISNFKKDPAKMGVYTRKFGDILENNLLK